MLDTQQANHDQAALWNESAGHAWVKLQDVLDAVLAPFEVLLMEEAAPREGGQVLDVGCGAGTTTIATAKRLGPTGLCLGVDISGPLITAAKARAAAQKISSAAFVQADAQTYAFNAGSFDSVISRFGVMFFDDPVAAFSNIRRGARPGARLTFVTWRSPAENPFMATAARAAAPLLPNFSPPDPGAPGQFAFADRSRAQGILAEASWKNIDIRPIDVPGTMAEKDLPDYIANLGPVALALRDVDESTRAHTINTVHAAFQPYIRDGMVRFTMACWLVNADA